MNSMKLLSDETRLRIYLLISKEVLSVLELQDILNMGQSRISTQLAKLKSEGIVTDRKVGKNSFYKAVVNPQLLSLCQACKDELSDYEADQLALKYVVKKRQNKSKIYFDNLAGKFGKEYVPGRSWKGLSEALIRTMQHKVVADFGAGEGTLAQLLAQRVEHVIAIDNSDKMIEYGSSLAKKHNLHNLEYRKGEIENVPIVNNSVDLVIISQSLHHAETPQQVIAEASRVLRKGGNIIILDLLKHQFEPARELYHDLWLGFSEVEIHQLLEKEGFSDIFVNTVDKELNAPYFQTLLAVAVNT